MDKSNNSPNKKNFKRKRHYCDTAGPTTGRPHEIPSTTLAHRLNDLNVTSRGFHANYVKLQPSNTRTKAVFSTSSPDFDPLAYTPSRILHAILHGTTNWTPYSRNLYY